MRGAGDFYQLFVAIPAIQQGDDFAEMLVHPLNRLKQNPELIMAQRITGLVLIRHAAWCTSPRGIRA